MLKLIKYEFKKNYFVLLGIIAAFVGLELYFVGAYMLDNEQHMSIATLLLIFASAICATIIMVLAIKNYQTEITGRSGYLVFMTPNSSLKIVCSKVLYAVVLGVLAMVIIGGTAIFDVYLLGVRFNENYGVFTMIKMICEELNMDYIGFLGVTLLGFTQFVLSILSTIVLAYLAITLAATFLQNSRFSKVISFVIFVGLMILVSYIDNKFIVSHVATYDFQFESFLSYTLPGILYNGAIMMGGIFGCSALINKAINL